jgi:hypothetical protein
MTKTKTNSPKLYPVLISGKKHLEFIKAGYLTHHTAGQVTYMVRPDGK